MNNVENITCPHFKYFKLYYRHSNKNNTMAQKQIYNLYSDFSLGCQLINNDMEIYY